VIAIVCSPLDEKETTSLISVVTPVEAVLHLERLPFAVRAIADEAEITSSKFIICVGDEPLFAPQRQILPPVIIAVVKYLLAETMLYVLAVVKKFMLCSTLGSPMWLSTAFCGITSS
jgi:hypothetical protein